MQKANLIDSERSLSAAGKAMTADQAPARNGERAASAPRGVDKVPGSTQKPSWETELVVLRGETRPELIECVTSLLNYVNSHADASLLDLAAAYNLEIPPAGHRLAVVAGSVAELTTRLSRARERLIDPTCYKIADAVGIYYFERPLYEPGRVAFLFPGEGAQYLSMLGDLCPHFPEVHEWIVDSEKISVRQDDVQPPVSRYMLVDETASPQERVALERELGQIDNTMASVLAANGALACLLENLGLTGDVLAGHSAGELAALWTAGCISAEAEMELGPAMLNALKEQDHANVGDESTLLAVGASRKAMEELVGRVVAEDASVDDGAQVFVAMDNCPHQSVLIGTPDVMEAVEAELKSAKLMYERLPFDRPYHTRLFEPYLGPLAEIFDAVPFRAAATPIYSCTTAALFPGDPDEIRRLALAHWASPVRFTEMIRAMYDDGARIFVEVGPRGNLTSFVADILRGREFLAVPANVQRRSGLTQLNHLAAQLVAHNVPMNLDHLYCRRDPRPIDFGSPERPEAAVAPMPQQVWPSEATTPQRTLPVVRTNRSQTRDAAMTGYLAVMEQFLDDQEAVTSAFLQRRSSPRANLRRPTEKTPRDVRRTTAEPLSEPKSDSLPPTPQFALVGDVIEHDPSRKIVMRRKLVLSEDVYAGEHTVGGREVSKVDPSQHGLPIMPMTFTLETMAEVAAVLVPGLCVLGVRDVQLQKWLAFDAEVASTIEVTAEMLAEPPKNPEPGASSFVRVEVKDLGTNAEPASQNGLTAALGIVLLGEQYPEPPPRDAKGLLNAHEPGVTLRQMYQNLFHGPQFEGIFSIDQLGDDGVEAQLRVLPRERLFRSNSEPQFIIDPVTVDVAMHPSAAWHLEQPDQSGRILLPFELKGLYVYGPAPKVGTEFCCRSRVAHTSPRHFMHEGDVVGRNGRTWCRLVGVKSWRFYLPFAEVNFHGPKDEYFLTTDWPEAAGLGMPPPAKGQGFGGLAAPPEIDTWCVRLTPSADLLQPAMLPASAQVTLSPAELRRFRALRGTHAERASWLFGCVAGKDAVRILWRLRHGERLFPADIEIETDDYGKPVARPRGSKRPADFPNLSFAYCEDLMVGIAAFESPVGIAIGSLAAFAGDDVLARLEYVERDLLEELSGVPNEWLARFSCAKQAVANALGTKIISDPDRLRIRAVDPDRETLQIALDAETAATFPEFHGRLLRVVTLSDGKTVVATTRCESDSS